VRIFRIDHSTSLLTELVPFKASLGSGPRHGAFLASGDATYFFLVSELGNTVTSYRVLYGSDSLSFEELSSSGIYGDRKTPEGAAAAAALLTVSISPSIHQSIHKIQGTNQGKRQNFQPDDKYLLTSSRNATLFQIPSFEPDSSTLIPSDTLQSWKIDHGTGRLEFHQLAPAGGRFPRQFSVNRDGTLAAVGLQHDGRVVIVQRDVENGTFGRFVAEIDVPGNVTCVIWDD
jgi:6-phosphogluconolactonase (cycloisomerase 2 family)